MLSVSPFYWGTEKLELAQSREAHEGPSRQLGSRAWPCSPIPCLLFGKKRESSSQGPGEVVKQTKRKSLSLPYLEKDTYCPLPQVLLGTQAELFQTTVLLIRMIWRHLTRYVQKNEHTQAHRWKILGDGPYCWWRRYFGAETSVSHRQCFPHSKHLPRNKKLCYSRGTQKTSPHSHWNELNEAC